LERKIRIGAVSYLNTKPLLYGLENGTIRDEIDLILDYPSNLVNALKNDQIDIGLIPVAALVGLDNYQIVSDYCIGTEGEVASVCLFSEVPMEQIDTVLLDYQSRTSILLCKLLFEQHWKKQVRFIESKDESYIEMIKGNVAGLVIGDRALKIRRRYSHIYDLGLGWKEMTGLPFVFAVWVAKNPIDSTFLNAFNEANAFGVYNIETVLNLWKSTDYDLNTYFNSNISYTLDDNKNNGMVIFLNAIQLKDLTL
jgi:chorismate dehydratase